MRTLRSHRPGRRGQPRASRRLRPDLAGGSSRLEDRTLLATILTVSTANDVVDGNTSSDANLVGTPGADGKISLREAVLAATNTSGATEIDLPTGTYNLGNVGTGELQVGNIAGQTINIKGLGTAANTVINQTVTGNRIFNFDNNQTGTLSDAISDVTLQGATNVNRLFGGGAIIAGGPGDSLSLTNVVVQNNSTTTTNGVGKNGAGISFSGGGNLTITGSTFLKNTVDGKDVGGAGGAIAFNNDVHAGNLTITNSTFTNNTIAGVSDSPDYDGGALFISGSAGTNSITSSTFTGNSAGTHAVSRGGAIFTSSGSLTISKSRFFNDTATIGSGIANLGATITANDNWWGANAFPGGTGTDTVVTTGGSTTDTTRLALVLAASPTSIATGGTSTLTAKVVSTSAPTVAVTGTALEGLNLTFAPGSLAGGSVNPSSVAIANGTATTTYTAGGTGGTATPSVTLDNGSATTSITVAAAPTANAQSVTVAHATGKSITLTGTDPNTPTQTLTFAISTGPTHGSISGFNTSTGALTYTPNPATFAGADSFQFTVTNTSGLTSAPATVSLNVLATNPTANAQSVTVFHGTPTGITLTGTDPNTPTQTLTFAISTGPTHGSISGFNTSTGALTYTPNPATFAGADSFQFTVTNTSGLTSAPATVSLNVLATNPTANAQSVSTNQNTAVGITLTGSDPNTPAQSLTFAVSTGPTHGILSGTSPNLTYTPNAGYTGPDSFQFTAMNTSGLVSAPATVSINVQSTQATVSPTVTVNWGTAGTATLATNADGLRLLPAGRTTDIPWENINKITLTLSQAATVAPGDVSVTGLNVANYGTVTIAGSGTSTITITLAQPISAADRVTVTVGNANVATFTRRLDVLPGDVNDDGSVNAQDMVLVRNMITGFGGAVATVYGDINGDGVVDINDYNEVRKKLNRQLP